MMKQTVREAIDTTLPDGRDVCIEFDRVTIWVREHYGADGNRGIWMDTIDNDYAENIVLLTWLDSPDGHREVQTPLAELPDALRHHVATVVDQYIEDHQPAAEEAHEPDYDDVGN